LWCSGSLDPCCSPCSGSGQPAGCARCHTPSFFWFGAILWLALLGPLPKPRWFGNWARLGYVVVVRFAGAALANAFVWAGTVFYPYYDGRDVGFGLNPLSDQNVAGAIMMIEQIFLTTGLLAWLFWRAASQDEERQQLLDLAADRGYALSEERAERAAAGNAAERLRQRIIDG
jgi:cytochrome c oxidase assembly factor CtaG